jgi:uncharacterized protein YhfF
MIEVLVLAKDHRVLGGRLQTGATLLAVTASLKALGLAVSSPVGVNPPFFIVMLKDLPPGESDGSSYRNPAWTTLPTAAASEPRIWSLWCQLMLGGYEPPRRDVDVFHFGAGGFQASQLAHLVAKGRKRLTAGWVASHRKSGVAIPLVGGVSIVTDGFGIPIAAIRTNKVEVIPFCAVTAEMARAEGEGDLTLEDWQRGHLEYWRGIEAPQVNLTFADDEPIFVEWFEVLKVFGTGA